MKRLWWRLVAYLMLLLVVVLASLPFSGGGSRWLLDGVSRFLPLEIEYGGGTLAGELQIKRLAYRDEGMQLELQGAELELSVNCLWRSSICFSTLHARQLAIVLLPNATEQPELAETVVDSSLFEFPVPLEAQELRLDALSVQWQGGEWRQGRMDAAVSISGSTVKVGRALVEEAWLGLTGDGASDIDSDDPLVLPEIDLPLELRVDELVLSQAAYDLYGNSGQFQTLQLNEAEWLARTLHLGELRLTSGNLGEWRAAAVIEFAGQWPLTLEASGLLPEIQDWLELPGRALEITASGDLAKLVLQLDNKAELVVSASGTVNALDPALPFQLAVESNWPGPLALSKLVAVPEALAAIAIAAPLRLNASGSLEEQQFQLATRVSGLGYSDLDLHLAGSHVPGRLALDDLRLAGASAGNILWGRGELEYAERVRWSAVLESSGLELQPSADFGAGRLKGQVQLSGEIAGEEWIISLLEADLDGSFDGLPVRLNGYAGIDSQLQLLDSNLVAEVNGTRLQLRAFTDRSRPGRLDIAMDDLGRWLAGADGSLSLEAALDPAWERFTLAGEVRDLQWEGVKIASGGVEGSYRPGETESFSLDLTLANLALPEVELETAVLSARGNSTTIEASLRSRGDINGMFNLDADAMADGVWVGELAATTVQTDHGNWYLSEPVILRFSPAPARLELAAHCWQFGQARVCPGETLVGARGHTSLELEGELDTAAALLPRDLELKGRLNGAVSASWGPDQALLIDGEATGRDILVTRHFSSGESGTVAWEKIDATVHNDEAGLSLLGSVYNGAERIIELDLALPPDRTQALTGTIDFASVQLAMLAPFAPSLAVLEGELRGRLRLDGTLDQLLAHGSVTLSGGHIVLLDNPTELQQLELRLEARGDSATLQGQGLLGGGKLSLDGTLMSQPEWRLELGVEGDRNEILLPPYTQMLVSEQLRMNLTGGQLDLNGDVIVHEGILEHEQLPAGGVTLSDDVVEVDLLGNVIHERAPFDLSMNVGVLIKDKFKLMGDMVNATLGGDLQLRQELRQPLQVFGNLNVIGGELRAYQQRLRIQRGTVSFAGRPDNPELDVRAQREIPTSNVVVGLQLQGTLEQPTLEVFSDPVMSHGEMMSYLIRGRGLDSGASSDGVAMALSVGSGLVNRSALVEELNSLPGISNLEFGAEGSTEEDTAATVGGYIGDRLYLSYGMGIYEPINVLTARLYLQARLWLEVVSRLENSLDIYYSFDID